MTPSPTFQHDQESRLGVLLTNLGTPAAPTAAAVRHYLAEFLWDPRVVAIPRPLWWLILHGFILPLRPAQSARKYQKIWTEDGSPLLAISRRQAQGIGERLRSLSPGPVRVVLGMRYGVPSIAGALNELRHAGARRVLVLPLYPQYSAATVASTFDAVVAELKTWNWLPELRCVTHYHDAPGYIAAAAASIQGFWQAQGKPQRLLFSFHGLPKRNLLAGDPYHCECQKTARLIAERLNLTMEEWVVSFQSRFGRAEWLQPYTSVRLQEWAKAGIKQVDVVCPGFAADCLETLEEIDMENRALFLQAGGEQFRYIPALNDDPVHLNFLAELILQHCGGWPEVRADYDAGVVARERERSRLRAVALGADR